MVLLHGPAERALGRSLTRRTGAIERGVIGGPELDRAELAEDASARPLASPEVPDGFAVSVELVVKEWR